MADYRIRHVNAFPASKPEFPAQIHIFAIHDEYPLVEAPHFFESLPPNQNGGAGTPCRFTCLRIVSLRMFPRLVPGLTDRNRRLALRPVRQTFDPSFFEFC